MLYGPAVAFGVVAGMGFGVDTGVDFGMDVGFGFGVDVVMSDCFTKRSTSALLFLLVLVHGVL